MAGHRDYPLPLQFQAQGGGTPTFVTGDVLASQLGACSFNKSRTCVASVVAVNGGPDRGSTTTLEFAKGPNSPQLTVGDRIRLARTKDPSTGASAYIYDDQVRDLPLGLLTLAFAVAVVAVARWRGLTALAGLGIAYGVLVFFVLPALLAGKPALAVGLIASAAILFPVLYLCTGRRLERPPPWPTPC